MLERMEVLIREEQLIPRGSRVLCAVSGGADSVCLLAGLYRLREKLGFTLFAVHYNHTLRGEESDRDEEFVRELVKNSLPGVELFVGRGDVAAEAARQGAGLEETARQMRYAFFRETARRAAADRIATAHTADDNAETILLHLARGAGLQGLGGIAPSRDGLIRPLLTTTRREVEDFLRQNGLPYVEDSTNSDEKYARNRVRRRVTPVLEELYPGFARRLTENAASLRADEAYLTARAGELAGQARETEEGLSLPAALLVQAHGPVAVRAVRQLLSRLRGGDDTCAAHHLEGVLALCAAESPSGEVQLPGGLLARREYETLHLLHWAAPVRLEPCPLAMPGTTAAGEWEISCTPCTYEGQRQGKGGLWLSRAKAPELAVRPRQTGDMLRLPGRPEKTVKKWLVDEKIPRWMRDGLPILTVLGRVAAAAELGPDTGFLPAPGEEAWHILFTPRNERSAQG